MIKISSTSIWSRPSTENHDSQPTEDQEKANTAREHKIAVERPHSCIDQAIRVNYAGELAAARMYAGRAAVVGKSPKLEVLLSQIVKLKAFSIGILGRDLTTAGSLCISQLKMRLVSACRGLIVTINSLNS